MEQPQETTAETVFTNIANLIRIGLYQHQHQQFVNDAIGFLENLAAQDKAAREGNSKQAKADKKRARKAAKAATTTEPVGA